MTSGRVRHIITTFLYLILVSFKASAQEIPQPRLDTLKYEELLTLFNEYEMDSTNQERIARTYLKRAQNEGDTIKMARGYDRLARIFHHKKNIAFADSIVALTKDMRHITYPAMGYMLKGFSLYSLNDLAKSNYNFKIAYELAMTSENVQQQVYIMDLMIASKSIWGNKEDALKMQKDRHKIVMSEDYIDKINAATRVGAQIDSYQIHLYEQILSNQNFILCHLNLKNIDSTSYYQGIAHELLQDYNWVHKNSMINWLVLTKVENSYLKKDYNETIKYADQLLNESPNQLSINELFDIHYFKGLSYQALENSKLGFYNFNLADSLYRSNTSKISFHPFDRGIFENLLSYYRTTDNIPKQIHYLNELIKFDSILISNYRYFEPSMIKNFETPMLMREKEILINRLQKNNTKSRTLNIISLFIVGLFSFLTIHYFQRQLIYKKRFERIVKGNASNGENKTAFNNEKNQLSSEIVNSILGQLDKFEFSKDYLSDEVSLYNLSKSFNTNPNYLSRIINLKIGKNFSNYINDLRIDFAMRQVLTDPKMRKYTIAAIAQECGYKNAESFSKAFYKRHGIYPSYYIKKLNKNS